MHARLESYIVDDKKLSAEIALGSFRFGGSRVGGLPREAAILGDVLVPWFVGVEQSA